MRVKRIFFGSLGTIGVITALCLLSAMSSPVANAWGGPHDCETATPAQADYEAHCGRQMLVATDDSVYSTNVFPPCTASRLSMPTPWPQGASGYAVPCPQDMSGWALHVVNGKVMIVWPDDVNKPKAPPSRPSGGFCNLPNGGEVWTIAGAPIGSAICS